MKIWKVMRTAVRGAGFAASVGMHVGTNVVKGAVSLAGTAAEAVQKTGRGDWEGLERLAERTVEGVGRAVEGKFRATGELLDEADRCLQDPDRRFFTKKNAARTAAAATLAVTAVAGASALDLDCAPDMSDAPDFDGADAAGSAGFAPGDLSVENGVFTGGEEQLGRLIEYGQVDGAEHVPADEVVRSIASRDAFLSAHGFDGVPDGYQVHHVRPLSEGGADAPENMILVSDEEHAAITSAHASFYGWRNWDA